ADQRGAEGRGRSPPVHRGRRDRRAGGLDRLGGADERVTSCPPLLPRAVEGWCLSADTFAIPASASLSVREYASLGLLGLARSRPKYTSLLLYRSCSHAP